MGLIANISCVVCGEKVEQPVSSGVCPRCYDLFSVLEVSFDLERAGVTLTKESLATRPFNHWRYHELLPVDFDAEAFAWPVGWTPLMNVPRLASWAGLSGSGQLWVKDEGRNPTASFKDRASSVGVLHALQGGAERISCASTGNAASSLAGYAAMAGLAATIFVPQVAPEPKLTQMLAYGAEVRRVRGTYAEAYELCSAECLKHGWYNRNCAINPYLIEGKKTCGLEIAEQMAAELPDWVVVSVGDGCGVAGICKGLEEMKLLGFIERVPRVLGVQAAGVDPVAQAFEHGSLPDDLQGVTIAESIGVAVPRNWRKAVDRVRGTGGSFITVTDEAIGEALKASGELAGVFAEPAAAAAVAGVKRALADGVIEGDAKVVAVITGSGLKDIKTAGDIVGRPIEVTPTGEVI